MRSIFEYILLAIQIFLDAVSHKNLWQLLHERVYFARVVIPCYMDLTTLNCQQNPIQNPDNHFIELNLEDLYAGNLTFSIHNRFLKAPHKIKKGFRGFALLNGSTVIGDIWCIAPRNQNTPISDTELEMLGITCSDGDAFAADMFIDPAFRGNKLAVPMYLSLALLLKSEGWRRIYASYFEDNISAKWMHLMLKFKELPKLRESRFFFIRNTYKYN